MSGYRLPDRLAALLVASDKRIVITGASGWLGMATLELLHGAIGEDFAARVHCFGSQTRSLWLDDGTEVPQRALNDLTALPCEPTILLHLAFLTKERAETMAEADFVAANRALTAQVMDALETIGAEALFYPSSGAVYAADDAQASPAMRLYGAMKREGEDAVTHWANQRGRRAAIVRLFNLSGPHINKPEAYALASFIRDAQAGRPVEVHAQKPVIRSYVAIREIMAVIFGLLLEGPEGITHMDTVGERVVDMRELAGMVATQVGTGRVVALPIDPARPSDRYIGDAASYRLWRDRFHIAPVGLSRQIAETAEWLARQSR